MLYGEVYFGGDETLNFEVLPKIMELYNHLSAMCRKGYGCAGNAGAPR